MIKYFTNKEIIAIAKESKGNKSILKENGITESDLINILTNKLDRETQPNDGDTKGQFMYKKVSDFLNSTMCDKKGFVDELLKDHRTLQQSAFDLCLRIVKAFSELTDYQYDGRNASSVRKAKIMAKALEENEETLHCPMI